MSIHEEDTAIAEEVKQCARELSASINRAYERGLEVGVDVRVHQSLMRSHGMPQIDVTVKRTL